MATSAGVNEQGVVSAKVQEDGKSVVLTLGKNNATPSIAYVVKNGSTDNVVEVSLGETVEFEKLKAVDSAFPTILGIKLTGPKSVEVTFSEPVYKDTPVAAVFSLTDAAGKKIGVSSSGSASANLEVMTLTALADLKDGEYTLSITGNEGNAGGSAKCVKDFAGYMLTAQDIKFEAVKDTAAATAEVVDVATVVGTTMATSSTIVTVKFSKSMETNAATVGTSQIKNLEARLGYNSSSSSTNKQSLILTSEKNEYTATFPGVLAPGTHTLYLVDNDTTVATKAKDKWGIVFEDSTIEFAVELDNVKPEVTSIVTDEDNKFIVTFSERVTGQKFIIKDSAGKSVTGFSATPDPKNAKKIIITLKSLTTFKGGVYTIEVRDAKDTSIFANKMDAVTISVDTTDEIAPTVKTAAVVNGKIRVLFSEAMSEEVTTKSNWSIIGQKVKSIDFSDDSKSVVITFENAISGAPTLTVINAKDLAGNKVSQNNAEALTTGLVTAINVSSASTTFKATEIALIGANEVKITYEDNIIDFGGNTNYGVKINNAQYLSTDVESVTVDNVNGTDTVVTLKLKDVAAAATNNVTTVTDMAVQAQSTTAINQYDQRIDTTVVNYTDTNSDGDNIIVDSAAPKMISAVASNGSKNVDITFSERLYAGSVNEADFDVSGYIVKKVEVGNPTTNDVRLKLDEVANANESFTVKMVGEVEDIDRNKTTETLEFNNDITVGVGTISVADVTIAAAPVLGANKNTVTATVSADDNYTLASLTLYNADGVTPAPSILAGGVAYKATIVLTAKTGYAFSNASTLNVNHGTAGVATTAGNTCTFVVTFDATATPPTPPVVAFTTNLNATQVGYAPLVVAVATGANETATYVWYKDDAKIAGATADTYTPTAAASYKVAVTLTDSVSGLISTPTDSTSCIVTAPVVTPPAGR